MVQVLYKGRKRLVHIGGNNGKYVIVKGIKRYLRPKTKTVKKKSVKTVKKKPVKTTKGKKKMKGGTNYNYENPPPNKTNAERKANERAARVIANREASNSLLMLPGETPNQYESRLARMGAEMKKASEYVNPLMKRSGENEFNHTGRLINMEIQRRKETSSKKNKASSNVNSLERLPGENAFNHQGRLINMALQREKASKNNKASNQKQRTHSTAPNQKKPNTSQNKKKKKNKKKNNGEN